MQKMVVFFEGAHHPSELFGAKVSEWSDGNPDAWAASVATAIEVARSGEVIAPADRGGKDWHFWAACAAMQRSIIGVYKANRGNWSACDWRFTGGQATRLNGSRKSSMLDAADVTRILTEDEDPIVTTPYSNLPLSLARFMTHSLPGVGNLHRACRAAGSPRDAQPLGGDGAPQATSSSRSRRSL